MLTVTKTADDGMFQSFTLPGSVREKVWVRVVDTDQTQGHSTTDTLYVDQMLLEVNGIAVSTDSPPVVSVSAPSEG